MRFPRLRRPWNSNDADAIKSAQEELTQTSHKLAEAMYAKASQGAKASGAGPEAGPQAEPRTSQEDVVDADFEDVKDRK